MEKFFKTFVLGLTFGLGFFVIFGMGYLFLRARSTSNPGLSEQAPVGWLYVWEWDTLTAAKWNKLVNNVSQINYDGTSTIISWTLDLDYRICEVFSPTKTKAYNCDGTINSSITNTSYAYYASPATDVVDLLCPTWYITLSGGGISDNYMRESRTLWWTRRRIASSWTISVISVSCVKIK